MLDWREVVSPEIDSLDTPRLLVAEGNTAEVRDRWAADNGATPGDAYAAILRWLAPGAAVDVCCPADENPRLPGSIESYDGLVITGSSLNIYRCELPALRQIEFVRAAYAAGVPMFGSCWGLQVATVAAGGVVALNPRGREGGFARGITLTEAGRDHPLHAGRPAVFDAPAMHTDEVATLPPDAVVTATNDVSAIQALEIRHGRTTFWGVQYHPEFTLHDVADLMRVYGSTMITEGAFGDADEVARYTNDLRHLHEQPSSVAQARRLALGEEILDARKRTREIANWLDALDRSRRPVDRAAFRAPS